jgi:hypothetical protein
MTHNLPDSLRSKIAVNTVTGCWDWTALRHPSGYGRASWAGRAQYAHCIVFELLVGGVQEGLELDHLCRVRHCVNPAHLEPVSHRTNVLRGCSMVAENVTKTHCAHGHELAGANLMIIRGKHRDCRECHRRRTRESRRRLYTTDPTWRERAKAASRDWKRRQRARARVSITK